MKKFIKYTVYNVLYILIIIILYIIYIQEFTQYPCNIKDTALRHFVFAFICKRIQYYTTFYLYIYFKHLHMQEEHS